MAHKFGLFSDPEFRRCFREALDNFMVEIQRDLVCMKQSEYNKVVEGMDQLEEIKDILKRMNNFSVVSNSDQHRIKEILGGETSDR